MGGGRQCVGHRGEGVCPVLGGMCNVECTVYNTVVSTGGEGI